MITTTINPETIASSFISSVFVQHNPTIAASFATGDLKQKIANTSEAELNQLKLITDFEVADITVETKQPTNLSVVSMKTTMTLNGNDIGGEQNLVLKFINNQWLVYHF